MLDLLSVRWSPWLSALGYTYVLLLSYILWVVITRWWRRSTTKPRTPAPPLPDGVSALHVVQLSTSTQMREEASSVALPLELSAHVESAAWHIHTSQAEDYDVEFLSTEQAIVFLIPANVSDTHPFVARVTELATDHRCVGGVGGGVWIDED